MNEHVKKAVITGGSGPVGLALIQRLLKENIKILLFQRKDSVRNKYLPESELIHIEYCALEELEEYIPQEKDYDVFFHLGWANTTKAMRDDIEAQSKNVPYSCAAVDVAYKLGCSTFIGVGSQAEYGRKKEPLSGKLLCEPESAYGVMKLCACYTTRILCKRYNMRHMWVRILSGYGLYDNMNSMLISNILNSLQGKPLEFSRGEQIWDFVHMDDIANALLLLAQKGHDNTIYTVGSGEARPLRDYMEILCRKLGESVESGLGKIPYSEYQVMHLEADISDLKEDVGWEPEISFEKGIGEVIEFYREWKGE